MVLDGLWEALEPEERRELHEHKLLEARAALEHLRRAEVEVHQPQRAQPRPDLVEERVELARRRVAEGDDPQGVLARREEPGEDGEARGAHERELVEVEGWGQFGRGRGDLDADEEELDAGPDGEELVEDWALDPAGEEAERADAYGRAGRTVVDGGRVGAGESTELIHGTHSELVYPRYSQDKLVKPGCVAEEVCEVRVVQVKAGLVADV